MGRRRFPAAAFICAALLLPACADPPNKEMDQAQGAIDAARAAGAEQYATTEYAAATAALKNANDAVAAGDYRLALNYALESHEHAQNAARDTADTKARARADVERTVVEVTTLIAQGRARLRSAERSRIPRRVLARTAETLAAAEADLQKAGEAIGAGDYLAANSALEGVKARIEASIAAVNAAAQSRRRR
jgi:hypothetical protein